MPHIKKNLTPGANKGYRKLGGCFKLTKNSEVAQKPRKGEK